MTVTDANHSTNLINSYIQAVKEFEAFHPDKPATNEPATKAVELAIEPDKSETKPIEPVIGARAAVERTLAQILELRTRIQLILDTVDHQLPTLSIFKADDTLRKKSHDIIIEHKINLYDWRESAGVTESEQWWWYLDKSLVSSPFWLLITGLLVVFSFPITIAGINEISALLVQIFSNAGIQEIVFDSFAILGAIFQLVVGGGISLALTRRFSSTLNRFAYSLDKTISNEFNKHLSEAPAVTQPFLRWVSTVFKRFSFVFKKYCLPITTPFILFVFFLCFMWLLQGLVLPQLRNYYADQAQADLERGSVNSATSNISVAMATNIPTYATTLTSIGIEYESIGQTERAKEVYQQALLSDTTLLAARYLLANLLLNDGQTQDAIVILDEAMRHLQRYKDRDLAIPSITTSDEQEVLRRRVQLEYLLLVSRGRAFLQLNSAQAALQDLGSASDLIAAYSEFFITRDDLAMESVADQVYAISTIDFSYYFALANEARQLESLDRGDENSADLYSQAAIDAWETVIQLSNATRDDYEVRLWSLEASRRIDTP